MRASGIPCPCCGQDRHALILDLGRDGTPHVMACPHCGARYTSEWPPDDGPPDDVA